MRFGLSLLTFSAVASAVSVANGQSAPSDDVLFDDMPVVLTAARLRQPQAQAPAAVTIIDRDTIRLSGARNLPELLRLVPGFQVGFYHGHTASVSYHGLGDELSRRLQVLIDGRSVYEPSLARIQWLDLPLALDNIQRIEITRGPNSALYGANSFNAVINIITLHAKEASGVEMQIKQGEKNIRDRLLNVGTALGDNLDFRFSFGTRGDEGFDHTRDDEPRHDSYRAHFANARIDGTLNENERFDIQAGYKTGFKEIQFLDPFEVGDAHDIDNDNTYLLGHYIHDVGTDHEWRWQLYWNDNHNHETWATCPPRVMLSDELGALFAADGNYTLDLIDVLLAGGAPPPPPSVEVAALLPPFLARLPNDGTRLACGSANQNMHEQRFDFEWQDTWQINAQWRLVSGASIRRDKAESETYLGGKAHNDLLRLFAHTEYQLTPTFIVNVGAMLEHDTIVGHSLSPRAALNWTVDDHHTLRAIYAEATRTPDMFEEDGQFSYTVRALQEPVNGDRRDARFFQTSRAPGGLQSETIRSRELGIYGSYFASQLTWDAKFFADAYRNLVVGNTTLDRFDLSNEGRVDIDGHEVEVHWQPTSQWRIQMAHAYLNLGGETHAIMRRSTPERTSSVLLAWLSNIGIELSASYYSMKDYFDVPYELVSSRASKQWALTARSTLTLTFESRWRLDDGHMMDRDNLDDARDYHWLGATFRF